MLNALYKTNINIPPHIRSIRLSSKKILSILLAFKCKTRICNDNLKHTLIYRMLFAYKFYPHWENKIFRYFKFSNDIICCIHFDIWDAMKVSHYFSLFRYMVTLVVGIKYKSMYIYIYIHTTKYYDHWMSIVR